ASNQPPGLAVDHEGRVWTVSFDGAIERLDPATGRTEHLARRLPVPDATLSSVLLDGAGRLWLGHGRGGRVYELQSGHFSDLPVAAARADALAPGLVCP